LRCIPLKAALLQGCPYLLLINRFKLFSGGWEILSTSNREKSMAMEKIRGEPAERPKSGSISDPSESGHLPLKRFLDRTGAAHFLGVETSTLASWAVKGTGPPISKMGRLVRYDIEKLQAWVESRTVNSTATYGRST